MWQDLPSVKFYIKSINHKKHLILTIQLSWSWYFNYRYTSFMHGFCKISKLQLTSTCPPRSPDLTPYNFFLLNYVKYTVVVSHFPSNLLDLRQRNTSAVHNVDETTLQRILLELV